MNHATHVRTYEKCPKNEKLVIKEEQSEYANKHMHQESVAYICRCRVHTHASPQHAI